MNIQERGLAILTEAQAVLTNTHVVLSSKKHGDAYVNKDQIFKKASAAGRICQLIVELADGLNPDVIIGPPMGAVGFALQVATLMGGATEAAYADKTDDSQMTIRKSFASTMAGKQVLVVEDVLTSGASARKVIRAVRAAGGEVVGVIAICNRGGVTAAQLDNVPYLAAVVTITLETYNEGPCPLCKADVPVNTDVGHGADFLARKAQAF